MTPRRRRDRGRKLRELRKGDRVRCETSGEKMSVVRVNGQADGLWVTCAGQDAVGAFTVALHRDSIRALPRPSPKATRSKGRRTK